ncbi:uncharacterized protein LOC144434993 [Glandiceps talaboti]
MAFGMPLSVVSWIFIWGIQLLFPVNAYFGKPLLHGADDRFDNMGEARIDDFYIDNGSVVLDIVIENTRFEDELWVLDFQPYDFDPTKPPVLATDGGKLVAANTGNCSNVFSDAVFDENTGFYVDNYLPSAPGTKELFTSYQHGPSGFETNDKGLSIREDHVTYTGGLDRFLRCADTAGKSVWERNVYSESIQFNTTLYVTNVRPKNTADGESGISYIQSHIILYWRLIRTAIARFIITSTERLRPIFEYAIVRPIYVDGDVTKGPDRNKIEVEISFKTVADSDEIMAVYDDGSIQYQPEDPDNQLVYVKEDPKEVTVYYDPTASTAELLVNGESVPICPTTAGGASNIADVMCGEFAPANLPKSCHDYLQQGRTVGITLSDGLYDIDVLGSRMTVYCDMTRNGGGWTLILTTEGNDGFDSGNLPSLNRFNPALDSDYSILGVADTIKESSDGENFRYRIESGQPGEDGGIWEAPLSNLFFSSDAQPSTNIDIFGDYELDLPDNGGPQNIMPYVGTGNNLLTTGRTDAVGDFGTVVCTCTATPYNPAPWLNEAVQPETIWYWFKEDREAPTAGTVQEQSYEDPMLAPTCDFTEYPGKCTQSWTFTVVLHVDDTGLDSHMPVDATGEFEVSYFTYQCPNLVNNQTDDCEKIDVPLAIIGAQITLQSVVQIVDDTKDKPIVKLKNMYGSDPAVDLRDGARGVQHLEVITIETHFFPEFLRENLEMELTLFMVCVGEGYRDHPDGCLNATSDDRYVAYLHPAFFYESSTLVDPNDESKGYVEYDVDSIEANQQELDSYEYIHEPDIHRSVFTNKALSGEARLYTITNVFKLMPRNEPEGTSSTVGPTSNTTSGGGGGGRKRREVVMDLVRRDLEESSKLAQTTNQIFQFAGCPDNSEFDFVHRDCVCLEQNEVYSTDTFKCEDIEGRVKIFPKDDNANAGSVNILATTTILACIFAAFFVI